MYASRVHIPPSYRTSDRPKSRVISFGKKSDQFFPQFFPHKSVISTKSPQNFPSVFQVCNQVCVMCDEVTMKAPIYGMPPCGRVRVQPASPQLLSAIDNPISGRWIISSSALYLLEQMYEIENDPPLHMRQRLATDLEVSQRQVSARARPPVRARPGSLQPSF